MVKLAVINLTSISVTATLCNSQDLSFFSQTHPFQQGVAYPCGLGVLMRKASATTIDIDFCIIAVVQLDAPFHLARLQHSAFAHGTDGGTECRGGYTEQPYQLHFTHPHADGIGRHGNPAAPVHRDCCPFHRLCVIWRNVRLPCSQRRICRFQV